MGAADRPERATGTGEAPPIGGEDAARLLAGTHDDPFAVLGPHRLAGRWAVRALLPGAERAALVGSDGVCVALVSLGNGGLFGAWLPGDPGAYRLEGRRGDDRWETGDPYRFGPLIGALDEHLFGEGTHLGLWRVLGAHPRRHEDADGTAFAVWAPNARRVSVVGDFNHWDGRRAAMRRRGSSGVWEIFLPDLGPGARYKYEILGADGGVHMKADPVGFAAEPRPGTCSVVRGLGPPAAPLADRAAAATDRPVAIYEAHLGSWARADGGGFLSWDTLAERIVPHAAGLGFTHLEVLPVSEHPFDGSWGYQPVGLFAPTARHGDMDGFRRFVDACHRAGLGLVLDWVPAHFPDDPHGLARFDGTALYEHADPREGQHRDWGTLIYNFGRREVANFLVANALYWVREHGVDGLRVDAVASMLYRDYSRPEGQWVPNRHGGRENLEAVAFLRRLNETLAAEAPGAVAIAEESTAWPGVSRPVSEGGLGFAYKWNMGWMHDTLGYMAEDPMHRAHHHGRMSFGLHYAFSENFVLPLSHDEVVHGKGSILGRMPGDRWTKFANLRAYYAFMWAHPGKKLLFMGQEYGQEGEWNHDAGLPWEAFGEPLHAGAARLVGDLNRLYRASPALHARDCRADGFEWIEGGAAAGSVYAWARWGEEGSAPVLAVFNFSGVEHRDWRIGVPREGFWAEILNSDAAEYGGAGRGNLGGVHAEPVPAHGRAASVRLTLPPLTGLWLEHRPGA